MERTTTILHSDLNSFYASVEIKLHPELRGKAVAVCGNTEERHGIVLAKSEPAKTAGVKTGMANWEAKKLCPELIIVPPHYDKYLEYSKAAREIYEQFSDNVEPFGMDECWLSVINRKNLELGGKEIAEDISKAVKKELGLTISVGVSWCKVFAKLGSDMKKPDAITVITEDNFRNKVWNLPAEDLLYVGKATKKKLSYYRIHTIGDIARAEPEFLKRLLGVNGITLWKYANGLDNSRVTHKDFYSPVKSVGHGITCTSDLETLEEVWLVMLELSQDIGHRLRLNELSATGVQLTVKDSTLCCRQYQAPLSIPTQSPMEIAQKARELFLEKHEWTENIRALTVRAINLVPRCQPVQTDMFCDFLRLERREKLDDAVDKIRNRYGAKAVCPACLLENQKMPSISSHDVILPGMMYQ